MKISREQISKITNYDSFMEVESELLKSNESSIFNLLIKTCTEQNGGDSADFYAGMLLIHIEPKHQLTCSEILKKIASSNWNLSERSLPFYLISQFGKWNTLEEIEIILNQSTLSKEQTVLIETIRYWVKHPTSTLSAPLNYFEWQEVIEKNA